MFAVRHKVGGLGTLEEFPHYCRLVWEHCRHTLLVPKLADAEHRIRRHYPSCLECQPANSPDDRLRCAA